MLVGGRHVDSTNRSDFQLIFPPPTATQNSFFTIPLAIASVIAWSQSGGMGCVLSGSTWRRGRRGRPFFFIFRGLALSWRLSRFNPLLVRTLLPTMMTPGSLRSRRSAFVAVPGFRDCIRRAVSRRIMAKAPAKASFLALSARIFPDRVRRAIAYLVLLRYG